MKSLEEEYGQFETYEGSVIYYRKADEDEEFDVEIIYSDKDRVVKHIYV